MNLKLNLSNYDHFLKIVILGGGAVCGGIAGGVVAGAVGYGVYRGCN